MARLESVKDIVEQLRNADEREFACLAAAYAGDSRSGVVKAIASARKRLDKEAAERERLEAMYRLMREAGEGAIVAGIDEVGRGSVAGPLTVACVVLPNEPLIQGINDSKQLTPQQREELAAAIRQLALGIGIVHIPPREIDAKGMSASLRKAMAGSIEQMGLSPDLVLIDGNPVHVHPREQCVVKGDSSVACIAAASIIAKVTRDHLMCEADAQYPGYGFAQNKGYGSAQHIEAIKTLGISDFHRQTFCANFTQQTLF